MSEQSPITYHKSDIVKSVFFQQLYQHGVTFSQHDSSELSGVSQVEVVFPDEVRPIIDRILSSEEFQRLKDRPAVKKQVWAARIRRTALYAEARPVLFGERNRRQLADYLPVAQSILSQEAVVRASLRDAFEEIILGYSSLAVPNLGLLVQ